MVTLGPTQGDNIGDTRDNLQYVTDMGLLDNNHIHEKYLTIKHHSNYLLYIYVSYCVLPSVQWQWAGQVTRRQAPIQVEGQTMHDTMTLMREPG